MIDLDFLLHYSDYETAAKQRRDSGQKHDPLGSLQKLVHGEPRQPQEAPLSHAMTSFPDEVELCTSCIPGTVYGVCARQPIPVGTWIGPYEGRRLRCEEVAEADNGYMWEVGTFRV